MYLTDFGNPKYAQLKGWTWSFECVGHDNMHWRFDGKYLRNELGTYLARKAINDASPINRVYLHMPKTGPLANVDYNDDRLYWEYDPETNLLGYPYAIPLYLSRYCYPKRDEPEKRDCNWVQFAMPKLTDNAITTKSNEEVEQKFSLDYQGNFVPMDFLLQLFSVSIKFYAGGSCYKSWSGTNEAIKAIRTTTNLTDVCSKSKAMIPAQLETEEEAEQVNKLINIGNVGNLLSTSGCLALVAVTSPPETE